MEQRRKIINSSLISFYYLIKENSQNLPMNRRVTFTRISKNKSYITKIYVHYDVAQFQHFKCSVYTYSDKIHLKSKLLKPFEKNLISLNHPYSEIIVQFSSEKEKILSFPFIESNLLEEELIEKNQDSIKVKKILDCSTISIEFMLQEYVTNAEANFQKMLLLRFTNKITDQLISKALEEYSKDVIIPEVNSKNSSMDKRKGRKKGKVGFIDHNMKTEPTNKNSNFKKENRKRRSNNPIPHHKSSEFQRISKERLLALDANFQNMKDKMNINLQENDVKTGLRRRYFEQQFPSKRYYKKIYTVKDSEWKTPLYSIRKSKTKNLFSR